MEFAMILLIGYPNSFEWSEFRFKYFQLVTTELSDNCLFPENPRLVYVPANDSDVVKLGIVPVLVQQLMKKVGVLSCHKISKNN